MSRGAIFDALYSAAREVVTVRTGVEVSGLRVDGGAAGAEQVLSAQAHGEPGRHRLVVVADGARSKLARVVAEHGVSGLEHHDRLRRRQLAYCQRATRWLTPFLQSYSGVLGWMRDVGFPLMRWVPPVKRLMMASMAGVASGSLAGREPLVQDWPPCGE